MRLISTRSDGAGLGEVLKDKSPAEVKKLRYAILSHAWGDDEVIFEDIQNDTIHLKSPVSLSKVQKACQRAAADKYDYIWIDTCCIDKRNSAELSESINSMFQWYHDAGVCYAFLSKDPKPPPGKEDQTQLKNMRWFTRGWTLQELLAPNDVHFFSDEWQLLGNKHQLRDVLSGITHIDADVLFGTRPLESISIAKRMSWAAYREVTRPEDHAYCMLGMFQVNMPMLYGEGKESAFLRLQEEIMKNSDDQSIFAWVDRDADPDARYGLLARDPEMFKFSGSFIPYHEEWEAKEPYNMTNRGLRISLYLSRAAPTARGQIERPELPTPDIHVAAIDCPVPPAYDDSTFLGIYLEKLPGSGGQYARIRAGQFGSLRQRGPLQKIYVRQKPRDRAAAYHAGAFPHHYIQLAVGPSPQVYAIGGVLLPHANPEKSAPLQALPTRISARTWLPQSYQAVFPLPKGAAKVAAAIVFHRVGHNWALPQGQGLVVLLGSRQGLDFASDCFQLRSAPPPLPAQSSIMPPAYHEIDRVSPRTIDEALLRDFEALEQRFQPSTTGRHQLPYHSVRVHATPVARVEAQAKYYVVDISIDGTRDGGETIADTLNRRLNGLSVRGGAS